MGLSCGMGVKRLWSSGCTEGLAVVIPRDGLFPVTRTIGGQTVTIDGRTVNGIDPSRRDVENSGSSTG